MQNTCRTLAQTWHLLFVFILLAIPLGLTLQTLATMQVQEAEYGTTCSYIGIFYVVFIPFECYLLLLFFWLQTLRGRPVYKLWHLLQLIFIFVLGIVPGGVMLFPLFCK